MIRSDHSPLAALLCACLCLAASPAWAQASKAAPKKAAFEEKSLTTRDGAQIRCTYFPSNAGKNAPVAILLHGNPGKGNRLVWQTGSGNLPGFAQALQSNDFAVVTVDLRGHGENVAGGAGGAPAANKKPEPTRFTARDYQAMAALDLEAVKRFLLDEHEKGQLNVNKLAIVAADFSTAVALAYFEIDWSKEPYDDAPVPAQRTPRGQDVRALVLLSPDTSVPGLVATTPAQRIRGLRGFVSVMIGVGSKDADGKAAAKRLADLISPRQEATPYLFLEEYDTKLRGTDLLNKNLKVEAHMFKFLDEYVKKAPGEWRTRKSPLTD
jgi:pimeloyl-ACP methyl ester carboxylesterase